MSAAAPHRTQEVAGSSPASSISESSCIRAAFAVHRLIKNRGSALTLGTAAHFRVTESRPCSRPLKGSPADSTASEERLDRMAEVGRISPDGPDTAANTPGVRGTVQRSEQRGELRAVGRRQP